MNRGKNPNINKYINKLKKYSIEIYLFNKSLKKGIALSGTHMMASWIRRKPRLSSFRLNTILDKLAIMMVSSII